MERAYVKCCGSLSAGTTNWNEAYQLALEREDGALPAATTRQEEITRVERAFEEAAAQLAVKIVTMEEDAPRAVPKELLCYRDKNIFFRVLPDCRAGHSIVAALRGVLQSRSAVLTVPLTCLVVHRGTPVLAQALAPLGPEPLRLHGEGAESNPEVRAEIEVVADALNTPLPDHILCEVYRGLDGRKYVTSTNVTTIALDDATLVGGPLKRAEMLALCPCVTATCADTLSVLRNPAVMEALLHVLDAAVDQQNKLLSATVHFYGVNLCLLKGVLDAFGTHYGTNKAEYHDFALVVASEMLARTIKQEFYTEVQAKRLGMDDAGLHKCFAAHLKSAFDEEEQDAFLALVLRKYSIDASSSAADSMVALLQQARATRRSTVVERVSWLVGARSTPQLEGPPRRRTVVWVAQVAGRTTPKLSSPILMASLEPLYRTLRTSDGHRYAYAYPLQVKVAVWQRRYGDALNLASAAVQEVGGRYGPTSLRAVQAQRTFMRLLFSVPSLENIREAFSMLTPILEVYEDRAGPVTRARCHIEVGCCLLSASAALDTVGEATRHFQAAELLLPAYLRSSNGAWLYLQPSLGLVRCHQLSSRAGSVPLKGLVGDAVYFARVVAPADYCTEYLWELGMELAADKQYEEATQVLTAAYRMVKHTPHTRLDIEGLRDDTLGVYSEWNPEQYAAYCAAIAETASLLETSR